ncbi:hypothetical protein D3C84_1001450 [compost metagenome]
MMQFSGKTRAVSYPLQFSAVKENEDGFPLVDEEAELELAMKAEEIQPMIEGFAGPIHELFSAIREDRQPSTSGFRVRKTVEAVIAIYKAATTGSEVKLPITKDDPWYSTEGLYRLVKKGTAR